MFNYHCFNTADREKCNTCSKDGQVIADEPDEYDCPCNSNLLLKLMGEIPSGGIIGLRKEQNLKQRRERNKAHFKREVLPSITDTDAKKHHFKKLGIKS